MKMKQEHFAILEKAITAQMATARPGIREEYIRQGLSDKRFRWDCLYAAYQFLPFHFITTDLYPYLHDGHIDTALKAIMRKLT